AFGRTGRDQRRQGPRRRAGEPRGATPSAPGGAQRSRSGPGRPAAAERGDRPMSPTPPIAAAARVRPRAAMRPRPGGSPHPPRPPYLLDPRPDLAADTHAWQALLELAFLLDGEAPDGLFGALHGVRCCGARLIPADGTRQWGAGCRLAPGDDYL